MKAKNTHFSFTDRKIAALESSEKTEWYYDDKCNGLAIRNAKTKSFYWHGTRNQKYQRKAIAATNRISVEEARAIVLEMNGKLARGENPIQKPQIVLTLQALFEKYQLEYVQINATRPRQRPKTIKENQGMFRRYLSKKWGNVAINDITRDQIVELHQRIGENNGEYAANRLITLLKSLFSRAVEWELTQNNPCSNIRKFKEQSRDRVLQPNEKAAFWKALHEEKNVDFRDFLLLAIYTGQRKSNILAIRWEEIDFKRGVWTIPADKFKTKRVHEVALIPAALDVLKSRQNGQSGYVFADDNKMGHFWRPERLWTAFCKRAGLDDLRIHDLRRTLASAQLNDGVQLSDISKVLGHTNTKTTKIYAIPSLEYQRKLIQKAVSELRTT